MATQFARRSGIGFVGLRISNIMVPDDYAAFPSYWDDARIRKWNLWGYVDARDVASAARLALEAPIEGAEVAIIAAAETVMTRPSADLMAEVFPDVPLRRPVEGRETLLAIDHSRRLLGYEPSHRWSDHVSE
jgi:nucleoside-diphosphate-sugar epimerase